MSKDIFDFVKAEEIAFSQPITVPGTDWQWSFKEHVRLSTLYKNSQFAENNTDRENRPFRNIVLPVLNVEYRTEGFDVKDVTIYIDNKDEYYKSFLIKKGHDRWATDNNADEFVDDAVQSVVDYGGALLRDSNGKIPDVVPLSSIAFCDQTNMLAGPLGFKRFFSPSELQAYESRGWGDVSRGADVTIEEAIVLSTTGKTDTNGQESHTPGKYVECYEVHGVLPEAWLEKGGSKTKYVRQMQVLLFYFDQDGKKQGLTLFKSRMKDGLFKVILRDKIYGRALGRGGVEELFDPQVWSNFDEIVMHEMLENAAKVVMKTTDSTMKTRHPNGLKGIESMEVIDLEEGTDLAQVNTTPVNIGLFDRAASKWEDHARTLGGATEALLGEAPSAGTPFKLQNLVTAEGNSLHEWRRGRFAAGMHPVWRDWILPRMVRDLSAGKQFLEELSVSELQQVSDALVENMAHDVIKEKIFEGSDTEIIPSDIEQVKISIREQFAKRGSKHFLEVFADEMREAPLVVSISIAGKQKNLDRMTDKFVNIFRQIVANPAVLDDPLMADLFNQMVEYSGLSPLNFSARKVAPAPAPAQVIPTQQPIAG